jgi:hypothetical protein
MRLQVSVVIEVPSRVGEPQLFFDRGEIDGDWKCAVQQSGAQSVGLAVRVDTGVFQDPPYIQFDSSLADQAPLLKAVTDPFPMLQTEMTWMNCINLSDALYTPRYISTMASPSGYWVFT